MFWIPDNNMVENLNPQKLPGANEVTGHFYVRLRRLRLSRRMVVHQYEGRCCGYNRSSEYFASMNEQGIHGAGCDELVSFNSSAGVQD